MWQIYGWMVTHVYEMCLELLKEFQIYYEDKGTHIIANNGASCLAVTLCTSIRKVVGSNLGQVTGYPEICS
jgi:hypothetical protein